MNNGIDPYNLRVLAALLGAPAEESLAALHEAARDLAWLAPAVQELETVPLDRWQAEHTRLFISGFPKTACPPFESAYRHGSMGGESVTQLLDLYGRIGLAPDGVQADYLGVALECAAYLLESGGVESDAWRELWDEHLGRWVGNFANELVEQSHLELYRCLGRELAALFPQQEMQA